MVCSTLFVDKVQTKILSSASVYILMSGLGVLMLCELKGNFTYSTVQNTGKTGDMDSIKVEKKLRFWRVGGLKHGLV